MVHLLEEIFQNQWLIHEASAKAYIPQFIAYLQGAKLTIDAEEVIARSKPYSTNAQNNIVSDWELGESDIPENSIAVIPITGAIRKYGYSGSMSIQRRIQQAEGNPNIIAIVFLVESPGGMVSNTDVTAQMIKNCKKPTVGYVTQMVASAAMWLFSAMDYRILSSPLDSIGSIGTMASLQDLSGLEEKYGIKIIDIYATLSTKKNNEVRELLENNNDAPIKEHLDFINAAFHKTIRDNLGLTEKSEVFTGAIYNAERGIELGLANEINTFSHAVERAYQLGMAQSFVNNR